MAHGSWLSLSLLAFVCACDRRSDEELRAMIGDVVQQHLDAAKTEPAAKDDAPDPREAELAALGKRVDELEARLTAMEARAPARVEAPPEPSPPVALPPARPGEPDPSVTYRIPIGESHTRGPDTALVTVLVWSDFECPHCGRVEPVLEEIEKKHGSDVRFAFKHCPLSGHARAEPAAIAAEAAAEQGKFWEMHDKLFANMADLTDANFVVWAKDIGLDTKRFQRDLADTKLERRVRDQKDECTTFGIFGVPSFHVNGRSADLGNLGDLIDEEKREAEALVAKGTPRTGVYEAVIAGGETGV
jgi:protein-disulfide isomerase